MRATQHLGGRGGRLHYDFSLSVISRKPQQAKEVALEWCRARGLKKPRIQDAEECLGWTSFSLFSSYLQDNTCLTLEDGDTKRAFEELFAVLQKEDQNVHVQTDWRNLEKYMRLEMELAKVADKSSQIQNKLNSEEDQLNRRSVLHETVDFSRNDEVLTSGTRSEIEKRLQIKRPKNPSRQFEVVEA